MKQQAPRPGMRHREYWCAIFNGGRCDCDPRFPWSPDSQATSAVWRGAKTNQGKGKGGA
jgi:hypothetical protein